MSEVALFYRGATHNSMWENGQIGGWQLAGNCHLCHLSSPNPNTANSLISIIPYPRRHCCLLPRADFLTEGIPQSFVHVDRLPVTSFDRRAYGPIRKKDACSNVGIFNACQHVTTHLLTLCARMISHRSGGLNLQPWKEEQPRRRFSVR